MIIRRTLLAASAAAVVGASSAALAGQALSHPSGPPSTTPNNTHNPGASHRSDAGNDHSGGNPGNGSNESGNPQGPSRSHKCTPHRVGYVAFGTLESQTLMKNVDGTYSGTITLKVTRANHHAIADKGLKEYKVASVHVTFALADTNSDGSVGLDDLKPGDQVRVTGKITSLAKHCSHTGFTATTTIRRIVFHPPSS